MKEWILSTSAVVLLGVLCELILSEGRVKKYSVGLIRLVLVLVILQPVLSLLNKNISFSFDPNTEIVVDENFVYETIRYRYDLIEKKIESDLSDVADNVYVDVVLVFDNGKEQVYSVSVDYQNAVIKEETDHTIIIAKTKQAVLRSLKVEEGLIDIRGLDSAKSKSASG